MFAVQPSIDSTGQLIFTPAANANGTAVLTVTLTDDATAGGAAITTSAQTLTISVTAVNDAPSFTIAGSPITVNEDSGAFTGTGATSITDGDPEVTQALSFTVTNDNNGLFAVQPSIDSTGQLIFTPAANANGTAVLTVTLTDDATAGGAAITTSAQTLTISVTAVNDAPSFTIAGSPITVNEDSGAFTGTGATSITDGDPEVTQALSFTVTNDNNGLFAVQPSIDSTGQLIFTPAANANGTAVLTVTLTDDATAGGAAITTSAQTLTISVTAVNDAPSFTIAGSPITVNEDSGAFTGTGATSITDGDPEVTQALSFTVTNDNNGLFAVQPSIDSTGQLIFTPAANANGTAVLTVTLTDDATAGGAAITTSAQTLTISVTAVNDAPSISNSINNLSITEDSAATPFGGSLSFTDIDSGNSLISVSLSVLHGILSIGAGAGGVTIHGNGSATVTLTGTVSDINGLLASRISNGLFMYEPDADFNTVDDSTPFGSPVVPAIERLLVTINDNGATGIGGSLSSSASIGISVSEVNDLPLSLSVSPIANEDASVTFSILSTATAGPSSEANSQILSLLGGGGLSPANGNITFNLLSGSITYVPFANFYGDDTFSFLISDDGTTGGVFDGLDAEVTVIVTVRPVNDQPTFTISSPTNTVTRIRGL